MLQIPRKVVPCECIFFLWRCILAHAGRVSDAIAPQLKVRCDSEAVFAGVTSSLSVLHPAIVKYHEIYLIHFVRKTLRSINQCCLLIWQATFSSWSNSLFFFYLVRDGPISHLPRPLPPPPLWLRFHACMELRRFTFGLNCLLASLRLVLGEVLCFWNQDLIALSSYLHHALLGRE